MSANTDLVSDMLQRDLNAARELQSLLKQERELIRERKPADLTELIDAKNAHLNLLDAHARERSALLDSLGLEPNSRGWEQLLRDHEKLSQLQPLWDTLQSEVAECKALNDVNGRLINRSQQTLRHLIDLMQGKSGAPGLYNATGSETRSGYSNTVGKA